MQEGQLLMTQAERDRLIVEEGQKEADQAERSCPGVGGQHTACSAAAGAAEGGRGQIGDSWLEGKAVEAADGGGHRVRGGQDSVGGSVSRVRSDVGIRI